MYVVLIILTLICSILLICVVLVQKSKGGGLSSSFAGSNQIMGVRRTNTVIEKMTWSLAGILAVLAILSAFFMPAALTPTSRVSATATEQTEGGNFDTKAPEAAAPEATPAPAEKPAAEAPVPAPAPEAK